MSAHDFQLIATENFRFKDRISELEAEVERLREEKNRCRVMEIEHTDTYIQQNRDLRTRLEKAVELGEIEKWLEDGAYTREFLLHCEWAGSDGDSCWSARVDEAPDDCQECGRSIVSGVWPDDGKTAKEAISNLIANLRGEE